MPTLDDVRALGYQVREDESGVVEITGYGYRWLVPKDDPSALAQIVHPALHADRVRQRPSAPTPDEFGRKVRLLGHLEDVLPDLDAAVASWRDLTGAEKDVAIRSALRALGFVIRLLVRRFNEEPPAR